jgi:hypothetical protein
MMEAVRTSETLASINFTTWQYIADDSKLQEILCFYGTGDLNAVLTGNNNGPVFCQPNNVHSFTHFLQASF